jgi:hypothetical protein
VQFVPSVIAVNTERIGLWQFVVWVQRQLVGAKTSTKNWSMVLLHAILLVASQVAAAGLAVVGLAEGRSFLAAVTVAALLAYWGAGFLAAAALESAIRRIAGINGREPRWLTPKTLLMLFPAMLLTSAVYTWALVKAVFCRRVVWRGIEYRVVGRNQVSMVAYRPYVACQKSSSMPSVV